MGYLDTKADIPYNPSDHISIGGGTPTLILGPGAGAGSFLITGKDNSFTVVLTAGPGTVNNNVVFSVIFNSAFTAIPSVVFSSGSNTTASITNRLFVNNLSLIGFDLNITNPSLNNSIVYVWHFHVI